MTSNVNRLTSFYQNKRDLSILLPPPRRLCFLQGLFVSIITQRVRSMRVAQLVSALPSVMEVPSSILSDSNVCSDFSLICVAVALKTHKMEH